MGREYDYFTSQNYRGKSLRAAKELGYSEEILDKLRNAKDDSEISTIMYVAAKGIGER